MRWIRSVLAMTLVMSVFLGAAPPEARGRLVYRIQMRRRGETTPMEMRFALVPTPALVTRHRVQKPRFGAWRLEALQVKNMPWAQTLLLARAERLMYFSSPAPQTSPEKAVIRYGERLCPVWKVETPKHVGLFVYLVEAQPNLLVLSYLSGNFREGDVEALDIQLESFRLDPGVAPPEDGLSLLNTLKNWAALGKASFSGISDEGGTELVQ